MAHLVADERVYGGSPETKTLLDFAGTQLLPVPADPALSALEVLCI